MNFQYAKAITRGDGDEAGRQKYAVLGQEGTQLLDALLGSVDASLHPSAVSFPCGVMCGGCHVSGNKKASDFSEAVIG